uniref:Uncharacterized protein n=1 Tax=Ditylenchus dipsaci TaxID=166011 RepID=A0A915CRJ3_9BILA
MYQHFHEVQPDDNVRSDISLLKCDTGLILKRDGGPCLVYETYSCSECAWMGLCRCVSRDPNISDCIPAIVRHA